LKFFYHIVSTYENCFEIVFFRKSSLLRLNFTLEIWFAVGSRNILESFKLLFGFRSLYVIW
jgi:hypothetical protein